MTKRAFRWSPLVLAAVLSPALLHLGNCGDPHLLTLEIEADLLNRVVGFGKQTHALKVWTDGADTIVVRATPTRASAAVDLRLFVGGEFQEFHQLGTGGGEITLTVPPGMPSELQLDVNHTGELGRYTVELNPPCVADECDDANPCTSDVCGGGQCVFTSSVLCPLPLADLDGVNGFTIRGAAAGDKLFNGDSVGDMNADGIGDLAVTAFGADPGGRTDAGQAYVIFGRTTPFPAVFDQSTLDGTNGFTINGISAGDGFAQVHVAPAGDVNADGVDDMVLGAPWVRARDGEVYVVFGRATPFPAVVELSSLDGTDGFRIGGTIAGKFGSDVAGAGDFNNDGVDDLLLGEIQETRIGAAYVVYGHPAPFPAFATIETYANGMDGFQITGEINKSAFGSSVAVAGDVNGDGLDDLVIGAFTPNIGLVGRTYIVFGRHEPFAPNQSVSDLSDGIHGVRLLGVEPNGRLGTRVGGAGDVNGDGLDDVIAGEPCCGVPAASYVVFGSDSGYPDTIDLSSLDGENGFVIPSLLDHNAGLVGTGGDFNADGVSDFLVGASSAPGDGQRIGAAYLIYGNNAGFPAAFDVNTLDGTNGTTFVGISPGDVTGASVNIIRDINGDGIAEGYIGAADANNDTGEGYVVFGQRPI